MSDPEQQRHSEENDDVPELPPPTPSMAAVHANISGSNPRCSPRTLFSKAPRLERRPSHASSVDVGFFDPSGVNRLRQTLSHLSTDTMRVTPPESVRSGGETIVEEEKFDFEKVLREIFQK